MPPSQIFLITGIVFFNFLEGLFIMLAATSYFRLLPTFLSLPVGKPIKPELIAGTPTDLSKYVLHGKFVDKVLWLPVPQRGAWFITGIRSNHPIPTKWTLDKEGRVIEKIDIKLPLGPLLTWLAALILLWTHAKLIVCSIVSAFVVFLIVKTWDNLQLDKNSELKEILGKVTN